MTGTPWRLRFAIAGSGFVAVATIAGFMSATPALAAGTTWYVGGTDCSDSGGGGSTQPFCTISQAASVAVAGDTVIVAAGTYRERVSVAHSGAAGSPIVFESAPGATVVVTGGTNGFAVSSRQYVTIRGFTVTGTSSYGFSLTSSSNLVIADDTVTYSGQPVKGYIAAGIYLSNTTNSVITGNTADHNSNHGIYVSSGSTGNTVSYNEASWNANGYQRNANGIDVIASGNTIIGNVLHDNEDSGLQFYPGGNNNLATLNVSYNNGDHGIDDYNVTGGRIIGNTVYHNCTTGINVEGTSGNYLVENNIAVDNAVYPAYKGISCNRRNGNIGVWDSAPPTTTVNANLVYLTKPGTMYVFGTAFSSLAAMQAATGQERQGIQADPKWASPSAWDLELTEGSPAIDSADSGASGEQAADITGAPRTDDPNVANTGIGPRGYDDRGAYEFVPSGTPPPPAQPPTAALTVTPASGTAPLAVTADASGSTDPQGQALSYTFTFGDGTTVGPQPTATATHTYTAAGSYTVTVTVTDTSNLSGTASAPVTVSAATASPAYVGQIATNYSTSTHTSGYVTVWRSQGVAAGHLEVVTLQLTGTAATGAVTGSDSKGNTLTVSADIADASGHRLVVLYGLVYTALVPNDTITVSFPSATGYRMTADEVSGVTAVDQQATAAGTGSAFSSGATPTTSTAPEFVFAATALYSGSAPAWSPGWSGLTSYAVGSDYLGRAYQIPTTTGAFTASGTGSGTWLAACVTFH